MAYLKKLDISHGRGVAYESISTKVSVEAKTGLFHCDIDGKYFGVANNVFSQVQTRSEKVRVYMPSLSELEDGLREMLSIYINPKVTKELVIAYNIDAKATFSVNDSGDIETNAGKPGFSWMPSDKAELFGDLHATKVAEGGFSLAIGARVFLKITTEYEGSTSVKFDYPHKEVLEDGTAGRRLNEWCGMGIRPEDSRIMPYSEEAAMFFHNMIMNMVVLQKRIVEFTCDQEKINSLIENPNFFQLSIGHDS